MSDLTRRVPEANARYTARHTARELIPRLYRLIDLLETVAAKREAQYDREGEIIELGHAGGLRDAANQLRNIIQETP